MNSGDSAEVTISNGKFKDNDINESIIFNDGKSCTVEKTILEKHPFNTIINKSDLTFISPKIKDEGKTILNEKYILIKKFTDVLEDKIYGDGIVENKPQFKEFDFGYLDKKIHESKTNEIMLEEDITFENYETDYYEGGIELDIDNLIIDGNGHTIDAREKTRIFYCTGKDITLKNLTLKNGHSHKNYDNPINSNGGAIKINHDVNLTLKNCKFINNTSEEDGGAIYNRYGELFVSGSTLSGNRAENGHGGVIYNDGGESSVSDSTLKENTAWMGGAISNIGVLSVFGSTLTGNIAKIENGGAIYNNGKLFVFDSTLQGNIAHGKKVYDGGVAIYNSEGTLIVSDSTLSENRAEKGDGGVIYNNKGDLTLSDSTLTGNTAHFGGAICNNEGKSAVSDSTLKENTAFGGGAIYNNRNMLTVSDSTLTGNTSKTDGGAISNSGGELIVSDSTLIDNISQEDGGAINISHGTDLTLKNCKFINNISQEHGGAISNSWGTLIVSRSALEGNTTEFKGGAIYLDENSKYESNHCTFKDNKPDDVYEEKD